MSGPDVNVNDPLTAEGFWLDGSVRVHFFHLIWGIWFFSCNCIQPQFVETGSIKMTNASMSKDAYFLMLVTLEECCLTGQTHHKSEQ